MNPYAVRCTNYVDGRIYLAVLMAAKIKCAAFYEMAV